MAGVAIYDNDYDCFMLFNQQVMDHLMAGVEDIVGKTGNYNVRDKFKRFDNKFIRPLLIRNLQVNIDNVVAYGDWY